MNTIWDIIKQNIFTIIIIVTLIVAMPWLGFLFLIPLILVVIFGAILARKVHQLRKQMYKDVPHEQSQQQQGWWQRSRQRNEGEVTVVQTEQTEQRVSDDVGEYVDFKEIKEDKSK